MPLYDYRCTACGREVEVMHGINDAGPDACQHCGGAMRKALSPPAIHFKGSGWAKKDAAAGKAKPTSTSAGDKDSKKGDTASGPADTSQGDSSGTSSSSTETTSPASSTAGSKTD